MYRKYFLLFLTLTCMSVYLVPKLTDSHVWSYAWTNVEIRQRLNNIVLLLHFTSNRLCVESQSLQAKTVKLTTNNYILVCKVMCGLPVVSVGAAGSCWPSLCSHSDWWLLCSNAGLNKDTQLACCSHPSPKALLSWTAKWILWQRLHDYFNSVIILLHISIIYHCLI